MHKNYAPPPKLPNNRIAISFDSYFRPTWKQRFQILIGYAVVIDSKVFIDRKSEQVKAGSTLRLSNTLTPDDEKRNHAMPNENTIAG